MAISSLVLTGKSKTWIGILSGLKQPSMALLLKQMVLIMISLIRTSYELLMAQSLRMKILLFMNRSYLHSKNGKRLKQP